MIFQSPLYLLLLLVFPYILYIGWPRGASQKRQTAALITRILLMLCLIFGIAGLSIKQENEHLSVIFLLDVSDSMSDNQKEYGIEYIQNQIENKPLEDKVGVIVFGSNALVEIPLSNGPEFFEIQSVPNTGKTDIPAALQLAQAIFPAESAKRIILLSDGKNTQGDVLDAIELSKLNGVEIVPITIPESITSEALILDVSSPSRLQEGEKFDLVFTVSASETMNATIRILADGTVIYEAEQPIDSGEHTYTIPLEANRTGIIDFNVQIIPENDTFIQNNQKSAFTVVTGAAKILVVSIPPGTIQANGEPRIDETSVLLSVFDSINIEYVNISPERLPVQASLLTEYNAVVLVNIPARQLLEAQMQALQNYARDLGGGIITIGGPTSYGVGGYYKTPLEEMLPVDMLIKDELRRASVTMVFVIDRSGSMADTSSGTGKLALAKEAASRSIELLLPFDKVGVIIFDENASWVVPIQEVGDGLAIVDAIGTIRSGGGTDILSGVQAVNSALPADDSQAKHVILLTDGGADATGIPELVQKLHDEDGITLTTIGVGFDAAPFLVNLAEIGGGRYHYVTNPASIPSIFTEETMLAARSYIIEEPFFPKLQSNSPILAGIREVPQLQGYIGTSSKPTATTILVSDQGDPILASWQYGLGKVVSFTSDATGRWAQDWLNWNGFSIFWGQAISYVSVPLENPAIDYEVVEQDGTYTLVVTEQETNQIDLSDAEIIATMLSPNGESTQIILTQTGANRFEAPLDIENPGNYTFGVAGTNSAGTIQFVETFGWTQSYSLEYLPQDDSTERILLAANPSVNEQEIFKHTLIANPSYQAIWQSLLVMAIFLLVLDIAIRRLVISRRDIAEWFNVIRPQRVEQEAETRKEQFSSLTAAKNRATQSSEGQKIAPIQNTPKATKKTVIINSKLNEATKETKVANQEKAENKKSPETTRSSTTAALLKKKRENKKYK